MFTTNRKSLFVVRISLVFVLIVVFSLPAVTPVGAAGTMYVAPGGLTTGSCASWANACNLQYTLGSATSGSALWVKKGTYSPTSSTNRTISFVLKNGVAIYGGFVGTETLLTQRNPTKNITILSGDIGVPNNKNDNSYHVVLGGGTNNTAILDGFQIQGGNANSSSFPDNVGGGMYNASSSPMLKNLTFSSNSADSGGGLYNASSSNPTLTNVTFSNNSAASLGGGMYNLIGNSSTLTNVTFNGNSANSGGGLFNGSSSPTLTNATFKLNSAISLGGGIYNQTGSPTLTNVTLSGNSAAFGGGMYNSSSSSPIVKNSILYDDIGGEISNNSSSATVTYSIVQGGYTGTGNKNANPLLGPLANNGGYTKTMALKNGSPAIDAGNDANCPAKDQRGVTRPQRAHCDMGAYEAPVILTLRSAANDGWILESTEISGIGGTMNGAAMTLNIGDDAANKQYRSILSFDTSSLPDSAAILKVTFRIRTNGVVGGGDPLSIFQGIRLDIKKGTFGTSALELGDFSAAADKTYGPFNPALSGTGWYSLNLTGGKGYINKTGSTQLRLRYSLDDNNNSIANLLRLFSGNATATNRPQLIIEYYVP
jgi:predicted outer membrane repeat protein